MQFNKWILGLVACATFLLTPTVKAQTVAGITIPPITGTTITINGQSFLLTETNGIYTATSSGPNGNVSVTSPTSATEALQMAQQMIAANNPNNTNYYGFSEIEARLGAAYEQNSGTSVAVVSVTKWGLIPNQPIGFEGAILQGNQGGTSGTAGGYASIEYRRIIGDVACIGGAGAGYDNVNKQAFGLVKGGVEYRQNKNLGEWVELTFALEKGGNVNRGAGFAAGVSYSFQ